VQGDTRHGSAFLSSHTGFKDTQASNPLWNSPYPSDPGEILAPSTPEDARSGHPYVSPCYETDGRSPRIENEQSDAPHVSQGMQGRSPSIARAPIHSPYLSAGYGPPITPHDAPPLWGPPPMQNALAEAALEQDGNDMRKSVNAASGKRKHHRKEISDESTSWPTRMSTKSGVSLKAATGGDSAIQSSSATDKDELQSLNEALDWLADTGTLFLNKYVVTHDFNRCVGGQGLVQFVQLRGAREEFAIKFFILRYAFERERDLYKNPNLRSMMPATREMVENEDLSVRVGRFVMPPCIVLESGESLQKWAMREDRDLVTTFQVPPSRLWVQPFICMSGAICVIALACKPHRNDKKEMSIAKVLPVCC
jgi:hypothetical protein